MNSNSHLGWGELWGIADRTDFDLNAHAKVSGKNLDYTDPVTNEKYVPYVIEPSLGVERMVLALLCNAYEEQELEGGDSRVVMHFHPAIAPYKVAVLPLQKKALGEKSEELYRQIFQKILCNLRRNSVYRQEIPPSRRNRHAVLRDRRLRHIGRQLRNSKRT